MLQEYECQACWAASESGTQAVFVLLLLLLSLLLLLTSFASCSLR
jgi:hypothetical protein